MFSFIGVAGVMVPLPAIETLTRTHMYYVFRLNLCIIMYDEAQKNKAQLDKT